MSADTHKKPKKFVQDRDAVAWKGRYEPYDLAKEFLIALIVVIILVAGLAVLFGSPDDKPVTVRSWSNADAVGFATTVITELDGSSGTATYGPPYNLNGTTAGKLGPINPAKWLGVHQPDRHGPGLRPRPLSTLPNQPQVQAAVAEYQAASPDQQAKWNAAYEKAVADAKFVNGQLLVPPGDYGPVATLVAAETAMARSGALDGALLSSRQFYGTDYTKPLLFIADGDYFANLGSASTCRVTSGG